VFQFLFEIALYRFECSGAGGFVQCDGHGEGFLAGRVGITILL
jgi:hypothetical protein